MVIVDIYVPAVDKDYNFSLNEDIDIGAIINEIAEMIGQKEQTHVSGDQADLCLYCLNDKRLLPRQKSLTQCGIRTGNRLLLI